MHKQNIVSNRIWTQKKKKTIFIRFVLKNQPQEYRFLEFYTKVFKLFSLSWYIFKLPSTVKLVFINYLINIIICEILKTIKNGSTKIVSSQGTNVELKMKNIGFEKQ